MGLGKFKKIVWAGLTSMLFLLSSCQYFASEYSADKAVMIDIKRTDTNECEVTFFSDSEYIAKVYLEECIIYMQSQTITKE
jgi:hypothetical protein